MMPAPFIFPERQWSLGLWHRLGKYDRERGRHVRPPRTALERISADDVASNNEPGRLSFKVITDPLQQS